MGGMLDFPSDVLDMKKLIAVATFLLECLTLPGQVACMM